MKTYRINYELILYITNSEFIKKILLIKIF